MNTPLITMEPEEAERRMKAYSSRIGKTKGKALSAEVRADYESICAGYRALARGTPLVDVDEAIATGTFDEKGRPRLALAPAHRKIVGLRWLDESRCQFSPEETRRERITSRSMERETRTVNVPRPRSAWKSNNVHGWSHYHMGYARVPLVPADVRPKFGDERDWFVLWEVEKWADEKRQLEPDRDPYLLKHLGGSLYAVIAEWDLTDLERSVMKRSNLA